MPVKKRVARNGLIPIQFQLPEGEPYEFYLKLYEHYKSLHNMNHPDNSPPAYTEVDFIKELLADAGVEAGMNVPDMSVKRGGYRR